MAIFSTLIFYLASFVSPVYAATNCGSTGAPNCLSDIVPIIGNIISLLAPAAGVAFLIMFIVGGYKFLTSGGDPKAAGSARTTLTFAIIGVILVVVSWLILQLIQSLTGVNVTNVSFPTN